MLPVRRQFLRTRRAAIRLQAGERGRKARKDFKELKRRHRAAIKIQVENSFSFVTQTRSHPVALLYHLTSFHVREACSAACESSAA